MGLRADMVFILTGSYISGIKAVRFGYANRAFPTKELDEKSLEMAIKVAKIPSDL
jgi:enoyl-CoA hydratase/carnithine racemase